MRKIYCIIEGCGKPVENQDNGLCASHNKVDRKISNIKIPDDPKPINKQSGSLAALLVIYNRERKGWIKGKKCAVLKNFPATDVHHIAGRSPDAYYDEWAEQNGLPLLLDKRFWLPVVQGRAY